MDMLERFKMNCYALNRSVRVTVRLPKEYNNTSRFYPVVYLLDGQNAFTEKESYSGAALDLESTAAKLEDEGKSVIYVAVSAAQDETRRNLEYGMTLLADFISGEIHSYLSSRYRVNDYVYAFGCAKSALNILQLASKDVFKGVAVISPEGETKLFKALPKTETSKLYYFYAGELEQNGTCKMLLTQLKYLYPNAEVHFDDNKIHDENMWKKQLNSALAYFIL